MLFCHLSPMTWTLITLLFKFFYCMTFTMIQFHEEAKVCESSIVKQLNATRVWNDFWWCFLFFVTSHQLLFVFSACCFNFEAILWNIIDVRSKKKLAWQALLFLTKHLTFFFFLFEFTFNQNLIYMLFLHTFICAFILFLMMLLSFLTFWWVLKIPSWIFMIEALIKKSPNFERYDNKLMYWNLHPLHEGEELHPLEVTFANES